MLIDCPVSINGTAAVSCRRDVVTAPADGDNDTPLTPSKTGTEDFSPPLERPVIHRTITRTSWRSAAASGPASGSDSSLMEPPSHQPSQSLRSSSVDPVESGVSSSRTLSACSRSSKVSPSDIIRLADDKFDRHRAAAAAAARRRFVLMNIGKTSRPGRSRNPPVSAAVAGETERQLTSSSTSRGAVPDDVCVLHVDLTTPLRGDIKSVTFSVLTLNPFGGEFARCPKSIRHVSP